MLYTVNLYRFSICKERSFSWDYQEKQKIFIEKR